MNLYVIKTNITTYLYDVYEGHVIRCTTPERVVALAQLHPGDEGKEAWDIDHVELLASDVEGEEDFILSSFNAG